MNTSTSKEVTDHQKADECVILIQNIDITNAAVRDRVKSPILATLTDT